MKANQITTNTFEGKIIFDKKLTQQKIQSVNKVLDCKINNTTARERIKNATYDLEIFSRDTKNTVHPSTTFSTFFKTLNNPEGYYFSKKLKVDDDLFRNASLLNKFLIRFEEIKSRYYYSYNSAGEKFEAILKKFFGK